MSTAGLHWFTFLCRLAELRDHAARGFDPHGTGSDSLLVVRKGTLLRAYRDRCPHWTDSPLPWRKDAYLDRDASHIMCHGHGARFDIDSGMCVRGLCVGESLEALPLMLDAEGGIHVAIDEAVLEKPAALPRVTPTSA